MNWLLIPIFIVLGMWGGQRTKGLRRFGIPGLATMFALGKDIKDKKARWRHYLLSLLSFILAMGYGKNSFYMKVFKKDWLVRIMYGLTLAIPFLIIDWRVGVASCILLPGVWSIRAGSFIINKNWTNKEGKPYDFLWEDFIRYATLGTMIALVV